MPPQAHPVPGPLPGGYGPPPPPSGGSGAAIGVILAIALVVVLIVGGGITALVLLGRRAPAPRPTTSPALPPPPAPESSASPSSSPVPSPTSSTVRPQIAGWQGVAAVKHRLAYDVPPGWKVQSVGMIVGFEDAEGNILAGMSGAAGIQQGECTRIQTGVSGGSAPDTSPSATTSELPSTAQYAARRWANAGYTPKNGSAPSVQLSSPVRVVRGGITGYHVTATVTLNGTRGPCDPPRAVVHTVAFPSTEGDPVVFITVADRGVPLEQSDDLISRTISSIRPLS